jgi:hypothetical protein
MTGQRLMEQVHPKLAETMRQAYIPTGWRKKAALAIASILIH